MRGRKGSKEEGEGGPEGKEQVGRWGPEGHCASGMEQDGTTCFQQLEGGGAAITDQRLFNGIHPPHNCIGRSHVRGVGEPHGNPSGGLGSHFEGHSSRVAAPFQAEDISVRTPFPGLGIRQLCDPRQQKDAGENVEGHGGH